MLPIDIKMIYELIVALIDNGERSRNSKEYDRYENINFRKR
jgi:hypothetical protein